MDCKLKMSLRPGHTACFEIDMHVGQDQDKCNWGSSSQSRMAESGFLKEIGQTKIKLMANCVSNRGR